MAYVGDARLILNGMASDKESIWKRLSMHLVQGMELKAQYAFEDLWDEKTEQL